MTLAEIKALPMEEIRERGDRAQEAFTTGQYVDADDLACAALCRPDLYDIKAHPTTGEPVIHLR